MIGLTQLQKDAGFRVKGITNYISNYGNHMPFHLPGKTREIEGFKSQFIEGFVFDCKDTSREVKYVMGVDGFNGHGLALFNSQKEYIELIDVFESIGDCLHEEYEEDEAFQEMTREERECFDKEFPNWKDSGVCPACWLYDLRWEVKDHAWEIEDFLYFQYIDGNDSPDFTLADELIFVDHGFLVQEAKNLQQEKER